MQEVLMSKTPLVSIIVPVYNTEKYLTACIHSILEQSYTNIEVILVDDGSTDSSWSICDSFADNPRVSCYHKNNGGVSSARNYGLDKAKGEYISFVDSDDRISLECIEKLVYSFSKYECDFCGWSKRAFCQAGGIITLDLLAMQEEVLKYLSCDGYAVHACLYKKEILDKHNLRFRTDMTCSEDAHFNREYFFHCNKLALINDRVYFQNVNMESLSHKGHAGYALYFAEKLKALSKLCEKMCLSDEDRNSFLSTRAVHGMKVSMLHYIAHWNQKKDIKYFSEQCLELLLPWITQKPKNDRSLAIWYALHRPLLRKKLGIYLAYMMKTEMKTRHILGKIYKRFIRLLRKGSHQV